MIPKKIHYCWFGKKPLPELALKCIESWNKYCPEYEIIEWNEDNFDINSNLYVKQAYESKKWAFVSDYVRLYALYNQGGIYMDTDVEVIKSIDEFLKESAFSGFEAVDRVPTGIMGCEKENEFFGMLLGQYNERSFIKENGLQDLTTNVTTITSYCVEKGLRLDNTEQIIEGFRLYPNDYFCPKDYNTKEMKITKNTYTIHHFDGSWITRGMKIKQRFLNLLGPYLTKQLVRIKKIICG